jgi:hypothetical protein
MKTCGPWAADPRDNPRCYEIEGVIYFSSTGMSTTDGQRNSEERNEPLDRDPAELTRILLTQFYEKAVVQYGPDSEQALALAKFLADQRLDD